MRVTDGSIDRKRRRQRAPYFQTANTEEIREFVALLRINENPGSFVDIPGAWGPTLEFYDEASARTGGLLAALVIVDGPQLSWEGVWDANPFLLAADPVAAWLSARGVPIDVFRK